MFPTGKDGSFYLSLGFVVPIGNERMVDLEGCDARRPLGVWFWDFFYMVVNFISFTLAWSSPPFVREEVVDD